MWEIIHNTPFAAQGYFVRDRDGFEYWVAALRASFLIGNDGQLAIDAEQDPVNVASVYTDDTAHELQIDSDIAPFRPKVDLTLRGSAVAKNERPFTQTPFGIRIDGWAKAALAKGPRRMVKKGWRWSSEGEEEATSVPLSWRMAYGGADPFDEAERPNAYARNPIGKGWSPHHKRAPDGAAIDLPQIEDHRYPFDFKSEPPTPIGFGPVQPAWHPRLSYAGTYDAAWEHHRAPLFPKDFSPDFYQAAPPDQVLELKGGETIELMGLHRDGLFEFTLPRTFFRATTTLGYQKPSSRMRLIAVEIDTQRKRLGMVWNAAVPCNGRDVEIKSTKIVMKQLVGVAA